MYICYNLKCKEVITLSIITDGYKVYFSNGWGGVSVFLFLDDKNRVYAEFKNGKRKVIRRVYEKRYDKLYVMYFRYNSCTYKRYE